MAVDDCLIRATAADVAEGLVGPIPNVQRLEGIAAVAQIEGDCMGVRRRVEARLPEEPRSTLSSALEPLTV